MMDGGGDWPVLTLPEAEGAHLRQAYDAAQVILEFGSGGSTVLGAHLPGKLIFSVESDRGWAQSLQRKMDQADLPSPAIIHHVDIGPTGEWGRAQDDSAWRRFHRYPTEVWTQPWFRHPDLILIDGRFRPACFVAACLRITRPTRILFDDYGDRPAYHVVEALVKPRALIGRMADFLVTPQDWPVAVQDMLMDLCTEATYASQKHFKYQRGESVQAGHAGPALPAPNNAPDTALSPILPAPRAADPGAPAQHTPPDGAATQATPAPGPGPEASPDPAIAPWYPDTLKVAAEGTEGTYDFMKTVYGPDTALAYAEFGIYRGDTARHVAQMFPRARLHLFDYHEGIARARETLAGLDNEIAYYGNSQRHLDSYNWPLLKLIDAADGAPIFDYCFLDGAHTVAVDALTFFLCDKALKVGGFMDFDDYWWRLRGSSLDPEKVPLTAQQYTEEQIDAQQVKMIVDQILRRDSRYKEVVKNKIFQKIAA